MTAAGRLIHKADFERLMGTPILSRSAHFAVHHLPQAPSRVAEPALTPGSGPEATELSTRWSEHHPPIVDNLVASRWLGVVVPKRHARRAVTRSLLKRQIRAAFGRQESALPAGLWLVRLRQPFAPPQYISARSPVLVEAVQGELEQLLRHAAAVPARPGTGRPAGRGGAGARAC